ncbi:MAG: histone H1 [Ignavibacteria bacterium GWA2_35_9]|nr:MAG: histone H1 [Ignavibacteria bacterium GWA2_35_9]OGU50862.1 MAG: histone H1 [Ignavibacteria bacterium GWC2_36_12]OGU93949.1 MAG: histone H1 [Ignavibacteria bacterium RIFOXYB2_FULL_36_7]OGV23206.1 MAG: histone H1 [Ignavibacteria bacterium RIFOXYA2_FULL_37_17]
MNRYQDLVNAVKELEIDFQKFYERGQAAAGTRVRKGLSDLRKLAQDVRKDIQNVKAERKAAKSGS